jgi:hypothetical protein
LFGPGFRAGLSRPGSKNGGILSALPIDSRLGPFGISTTLIILSPDLLINLRYQPECRVWGSGQPD